MKTKALSFMVNGEPVGPIEVPEGLSLNDVLQEYLGLTGCRTVCGMGICHACTVILDSDEGSSELRSCITPAHAMQDRRIRTVEGHARKDGDGGIVDLSDVQQAFLRHFSFQCGYCTPGFVAAATHPRRAVSSRPWPGFGRLARPRRVRQRAEDIGRGFSVRPPHPAPFRRTTLVQPLPQEATTFCSLRKSVN